MATNETVSENSPKQQIRRCLKHTGTLHGDHFTIDKPSEATCAALFAEALAPWEGTQPLAFATEALLQLSNDLDVLGSALSDENESMGAMRYEIIRRTVAGLSGRARVAAEIVARIEAANAEVAEQPGGAS